MSDFAFELSSQSKSRCIHIVTMDFLHHFSLVCNSKVFQNSAHLRDISLKSLSDLELDLSRSFKVKSNSAVELSMYDFAYLLLFSGYSCIKFFFYSHQYPKITPPPPTHICTHPYEGRFFLSKPCGSTPGSESGFYLK